MIIDYCSCVYKVTRHFSFFFLCFYNSIEWKKKIFFFCSSIFLFVLIDLFLYITNGSMMTERISTAHALSVPLYVAWVHRWSSRWYSLFCRVFIVCLFVHSKKMYDDYNEEKKTSNNPTVLFFNKNLSMCKPFDYLDKL